MTTTKESLLDLIAGHEGKAIDKWEQYIAVYDGELADLLAVGEPLSLLEIGVQNGGSLEIWSKFLPVGSTVRGIDVDPRVGLLKFERNIRADVADAADALQADSLLAGEIFDIIIDDGSHRCDDVCRTFAHLFPRLKPGGRYIIEDLHCSYYPSYGGGLGSSGSSIELIKGLVDALHADYVDPASIDADIAVRLATYRADLARIVFYDSVTVITKLRSPKGQPYRRVIGGTTADVQSIDAWIRAFPVTNLQQLMFGYPAVHQFEKAFFEELEEKRSLADSLRHQCEALTAELEICRRLGERGTSRD